MKYHAGVTANQGLNTLPYNPCNVLDFDLLKLGTGEEYAANSGDREILAGEQRVQATVEDPNVGWVGRTVAMLKELGH